jgi:hypothetical protein
MVNVLRFAEICRQDRVPLVKEIYCICIVGGSTPIQPSGHPRPINIIYARRHESTMESHWESICVIALVQVIGQHYLLGVVHAGNTLRLTLCLGQGGQEERGQDSDDGDNDQKFDQGETGLGRAAGRCLGPASGPSCWS